MSTLALKFTSISDLISITNSRPIGDDAYMVGVHFAFKLDAGSTSLSSGAARVLFVSSGDSSITAYYVDKDFNYGGTQATNYFIIIFSAGNGQTKDYRTTFDLFAGMPGDGLWHYFSIDWNSVINSHVGTCVLTIDGVSYTAAPANGSPFQSLTSGLMSPFFPLDNLTIGYPSLSLVGLAVSNIGSWYRGASAFSDANPTKIFDYSGTHNDMAAFVAGIPAEVIATDTLIDVLPITGASPELGAFGAFTGTITGMSVVSGPPLGPAVAVFGSPRYNSIGHSPGSIIVDFTWVRNVPLSGGVVLTCVPSFNPTVPQTVTMTDGGLDIATIMIPIPVDTTLGSYSIEVTNSEGIRAITIPIVIQDPAVFIASAEIMANGNVVALFPQKLDGTPVSAEIFMMKGGSVSINGNPPEPLDDMIPAYSGTNGAIFCWTTLKIQNQTQINADAQSTKPTGVWSTTNQQSTSYKIFDWSGEGNTGTIGYSSDPGATSVDTFPVTPGRLYKVYRIRNDVFYNNYNYVSGVLTRTPTTQARRTITDGVTSAHYDEDQNVVGSFDETRQLYQLSFVGAIRPVSNTLTITLSNQAGTNTLYNNGHFVILQEEAYSPNPDSDTVVINLPDNAIVTPFGTTAPTTITCTRMTVHSQAPINPLLPHNMKLGYNVKIPTNGGYGKIYANLTKYSSGWHIGPVDVNGQLSGLVLGATDNVTDLGDGSPKYGHANTGANSHDFHGDIGGFGARTAMFRVPAGGNPTVSFNSGDWDVTDHSTDYTGGGSPDERVVWQQVPVSSQQDDYSMNIKLFCKSNGGANDYIYDLVIFDDLTPPDWPHMMHPVTYGRLKDKFPGGALRWLNSTGISNTSAYAFEHRISQDTFTYQWGGKKSIGAVITAIEPVAPGFETDYPNAVFGHTGGRMWVKITTATPHHYITGCVIGPYDWSSGSMFFGIPDTNGGTTDTYSDDTYVIKVDDTTLIVSMRSTSNPVPVYPNTLAAPMTIPPGTYVSTPVGGQPYQDCFEMSLSVGMIPWINLPITATDDMANKTGQCFVDNSNPGDSLYIEYSNERWNTGYQQGTEVSLSNENQFIRDYTGGARGYVLDNHYDYGHLRTYQLGAQCIAGVTGIPEVRIEGYGYGATAIAVISGGGVLSITLTNPGTAYSSAPTVHILGGSGTGAVAIATVAGGSVTGFTITNPGTGYIPTGRSADTIRTVYNCFTLDGQTVGSLANTATRHNFVTSVKYVESPSNYLTNFTNRGTYDAAGYPMNFLYDQLSVADLNDLWAYHIRYNDYSYISSDVIKSLPGFSDLVLVCYENAIVEMVPYATNTHERIRRNQECTVHSTMYWNELFLRQEQEHRYGFKSMVYFTIDDPNGMPASAMWHTWISPFMQNGTGDPSENVGVHDMHNQKSQIGGAHLAYVSYVPISSLPSTSMTQESVMIAAM